MYREVPLQEEHIEPFVTNMREADKREWAVMSEGRSPAKVLSGLLLHPFGEATAILARNGNPLVIWGVIGNGVLWMAATNEAEKHAFSLHRHLGPTLDKLQYRFQTLIAVCDARNKVHLKWLKWCGFRHTHTAYCGPDRLPFHAHIRT